MHLKEYLKDLSLKDLADDLQITQRHLREIAEGRNKPGSRLAKRIEEVTKGKVTRLEALYPEDFHNVNV